METGSKWPLASTATHSLPVSQPKLEFAKVSLDRRHRMDLRQKTGMHR